MHRRETLASSNNLMMSTMIPLSVTLKESIRNSNALMSLPTSLIHCILSDWMEVFSLIRLDSAFCGHKVFHLQLLDILKSDLFYVKKFNFPNNLQSWGTPPPEHPYTHMLEWIVLRHMKVVHIEPHALCSHAVLETFLQKNGEHVRHIIVPNIINDGRSNHSRTQNALIEKYCRNLTEYVVKTCKETDGCILRVFNNNPRLQKLFITGSLDGGNDPIKNHVASLHNLQQLSWAETYPFKDSLVALVKAAPNLQKLFISSNISYSFTEIKGDLVVEVARACPKLRTLSCTHLDFGPSDSSLRPFFAACSSIVNLDLSMHQKLTDTVLIEALSELNSLQCLNLRDCCRLTDRTLQFLAQRFASTLKMLYLNYDVLYIWEGNQIVREDVRGGYTAAGIANLRAQCTHLHTFRYSVRVCSVEMKEGVSTLPLDAYQSATIVHMCPEYKAFLPIILEHCQQMQVLTMRFGTSAEQVMALAARCPQLHTVIIKKTWYQKDDPEVDYSVVKEAFPKLLFTQDESIVDFDVLGVPV